MRDDLYWITGPWPGRLAVAARPRGDDWLTDEIEAWRRSGVQVVVSMLTAEEVVELELGSEAADCRASGIEYVSFPMADRGVPKSAAAFRHLVSELTAHLNDGRMVLVHCRQGIGRAGLIAVGLLLAAGIEVADAIERVTKARGRPVPETTEQRRWIEEQARTPFTQAA
jgi:protein-tyrosine phosphatase